MTKNSPMIEAYCAYRSKSQKLGGDRRKMDFCAGWEGAIQQMLNKLTKMRQSASMAASVSRRLVFEEFEEMAMEMLENVPLDLQENNL